MHGFTDHEDLISIVTSSHVCKNTSLFRKSQRKKYTVVFFCVPGIRSQEYNVAYRCCKYDSGSSSRCEWPEYGDCRARLARCIETIFLPSSAPSQFVVATEKEINFTYVFATELSEFLLFRIFILEILLREAVLRNTKHTFSNVKLQT